MVIIFVTVAGNDCLVFKPHVVQKRNSMHHMEAQHSSCPGWHSQLCCSCGCVLQVVQHSQAAAATVANEIDLMMGFQHPHLVSAYHFVTWRRRKDRPQHYSGDQVR
jgi:hypothetical protein